MEITVKELQSDMEVTNQNIFCRFRAIFIIIIGLYDTICVSTLEVRSSMRSPRSKSTHTQGDGLKCVVQFSLGIINSKLTTS